MIRPKKEDYIIQYNFSYGAWKEFDNEAYQEALEKYVDQLEKAFDKACEELEKCEKDFDKIYGTSYAKIKNKKYWKKELMEDD